MQLSYNLKHNLKAFSLDILYIIFFFQYSQFKCFRCKLVGTIGETHLNLWLSLKRLFPLTYTDRTIANEFNFERLSLIRKQHQLILEQIGLVRDCPVSVTINDCFFQPQFPSYGKHISKIKWTEYVLSELMQRLSDYWWPRVLINRCRGDCVYYERYLNYDVPIPIPQRH